VTVAFATAKINLALVVGPLRGDGKHEVATVLQALDLGDTVSVERAAGHGLDVGGFAEDTIVTAALRRLAAAAGTEADWHVRIDKQIPVAAGLGGGSSDAAAALRLANATLPDPLPEVSLRSLAAEIGADVPFFLTDGPQLGTGDGSELEPLDLPDDYHVLLLLPAGEAKSSTASVYEQFDRRRGEVGYEKRRRALLDALARVRESADLAALPENDLARSPLADDLTRLGAFRADVSGAGPAVYGLFENEATATAAAARLATAGEARVCRPARGTVGPP
jgi:4-diphosphocytidyl-2-C-methyl-D-erythritol kinase